MIEIGTIVKIPCTAVSMVSMEVPWSWFPWRHMIVLCAVVDHLSQSWKFNLPPLLFFSLIALVVAHYWLWIMKLSCVCQNKILKIKQIVLHLFRLSISIFSKAIQFLIHLITTFTNFLSFTQFIHVNSTFSGMSMCFGYNFFNFWVVLKYINM